VTALKDFMLEQGPSKNTNLMEWDKIWSINKSVVDPIAPRYTCIGKAMAATLTIENVPDQVFGRSAVLHNKNESLGHKVIFYGRNLLIEHDDAKTIKEGDKVTLMQWGNCNISKVSVDADTGKISLVGKIDEEDKVFKGTAKLTWLVNDPDSLIEIDVMEYDHLITKPKIEPDDDPAELFNKNSVKKEVCYAEGACRQMQKGCFF